MKTTKEKADLIYSKFEDEITGLEGNEWYDSALRCAIKSVEHTINVLDGILLGVDQSQFLVIVKGKINEQTELLKELKSRL